MPEVLDGVQVGQPEGVAVLVAEHPRARLVVAVDQRDPVQARAVVGGDGRGAGPGHREDGLFGGRPGVGRHQDVDQVVPGEVDLPVGDAQQVPHHGRVRAPAVTAPYPVRVEGLRHADVAQHRRGDVAQLPVRGAVEPVPHGGEELAVALGGAVRGVPVGEVDEQGEGPHLAGGAGELAAVRAAEPLGHRDARRGAQRAGAVGRRGRGGDALGDGGAAYREQERRHDRECPGTAHRLSPG